MRKTLNSFTDYLRTYDKFAEPVTLNIDGKQGVKTLFGTCLSAMHGSILLAVVIFMLVTYFQAERPSMYSGLKIGQTFNETEIVLSGLLPGIVWYKGYTPLTDAAEIEKYISAELVITSDQVDISSERVTWTSCDSRFYSHITSETMHEEIRQAAVCINYTNSLKVKGYIGSKSAKHVTIKLKPCTLGASCRSISELSDLTFVILMPEVDINYQNFYNPIQIKTLVSPKNGLMLNMRLQHNIQIRNFRLTDNSGLLPSWSEKFSQYELHKINTGITERNSAITSCTDSNLNNSSTCESYHELSIGASNLEYETKRVYPYLFQQFAVLGGLNNIIAILFFMIYSRYNQRCKENLILKHVFGFIEEIEILKGTRRDEADPKPETDIPKKKLYLFCRKKQLTAEQRAHQQLKQSALMNMRDNMNILNIVKELNHLKVLCNFFFRSRHAKVASFLELGIYQRNRFEREQVELLGGGLRRRSTASKNSNVLKLNFENEKQSYPWPLTLEGSTNFLNFHHALRDIEEKASHLKNWQPANATFSGDDEVLEDDHQAGILGDIENKFDEFFFKEILKNTEAQHKVLGFTKDALPDKRGDTKKGVLEMDTDLKAQTKIIFSSLLEAVLQQSDVSPSKTQLSNMPKGSPEFKPTAKTPRHMKSKFAIAPIIVKVSSPIVDKRKNDSELKNNSQISRSKVAYKRVNLKTKPAVNSEDEYAK